MMIGKKKKYTIIAILTILVALSCHPILFDTSASASGLWLKSVRITIDHDFVNTTLTNFPLLVPINATVSADCNNGNSIRFRDSTNTTDFAYEIEGAWSSSATNYVWVNVTSILSLSNTSIWLRYSNDLASDAQDPTGVWDSNYVMIQHMHQASSDKVDDSTGNNNDASGDSGTISYEEAGKVGKSIKFAGGSPDSYLTFSTSVRNVVPLTVEVWAYPTEFKFGNYVISNGAEGGYKGFSIDFDGASGIYYGVIRDGTSDYRLSHSSGTSTINDWYYKTASWDGVVGNEGLFIRYPDRYLVTPVSSASTLGHNLTIGVNAISHNYGFTGYIDEVRISDVVRSEEWLNATYHSVNQTTGFLTFGSPILDILSVSFVDSYSGSKLILTPTITSGTVTQYKWNISENDGIYNGTTGWINLTTIDNYVYTFTDVGSVTVTLYGRNTTSGNVDSYSVIIESNYEPPIQYEVYDSTRAIPYEETLDPITGPTNPWFPWATAGDISVSGVANIVLFSSIFIVIMFFFLRSRKRGGRRIKIGDYIIDLLEED